MDTSINGTVKGIGLDLVFTANEAVALTRQVVEMRAANDKHKLGFGTPQLDKYLIPSWPGDLEIVCGRPQNYKTGYIQTRLHMAVNDIMREKAYSDCVVLVTWEVPVEQAMAYWLAIESGLSATAMMRGEIKPERIVEWDKFQGAMVKVGAKPFYIIGHSVKRATDNKRRRPNLTPSNVSLALDYLMNDLGKNPRLIAMDYLQRIHSDNERVSRSEHFLQCVDWAKDTALQSGGVVMLGSQADRRVDDYQLAVPKLRDSQWTSNAEQSADKFLSLHMPKQKHITGDFIDVKGKSVEVSDRLLLLAVTKQKFGPAGDIFPLYVEPEYLKLGDHA